MRSLTDNPPVAFSGSTGKTALSNADWQLHWRVAYCLPRQEKLFATQLWNLRITFFFPMMERETFSSGRRRRSLIPLFPSYVFFAGDADTRLAAQKTNRIHSLIEPPTAAQSQLRQELRAIDAALRTSPVTLEFQEQANGGTNITFTEGPLTGFDGVRITTTRGDKLWLGISAIGGGVLIDMPACAQSGVVPKSAQAWCESIDGDR